jgi:hypothetical protein
MSIMRRAMLSSRRQLQSHAVRYPGPLGWFETGLNNKYAARRGRRQPSIAMRHQNCWRAIQPSTVSKLLAIQ